MSGASGEAIAFHYDVGTDFFRLWLDETLTYSCGSWGASNDGDLLTAQRRKLHYALVESGGDTARRVLDVGCGWGSLLVSAVEAGAEHAFGLTLSRSQLEHVQSLADPRIGVALSSFREYTPADRYDALCCVEAIEHFVRREHSEVERLELYREFFAFCHRMLAPGARMYLQFSGYGAADRDQYAPFFEHVFPESDLPRLWEVCRALEGWFEVTRVRNERSDYVRTLNTWHRNLRRRRDAAVALTGSETVTRYLKYLGMAAIAMQVGASALYSISLRRLDRV